MMRSFISFIKRRFCRHDIYCVPVQNSYWRYTVKCSKCSLSIERFCG